MKKLNVFIASMVMLISFSLKGSAQTAVVGDYFSGKWLVVAEGTPNGDSKFLVSLERKDGKLTGVVIDPASNKEISKINKVEEKEKSVTVYFVGGGYDVYLLLEKKTDDQVTGSLMDMFDAKGERVKDKEPQS